MSESIPTFVLDRAPGNSPLASEGANLPFMQRNPFQGQVDLMKTEAEAKKNLADIKMRKEDQDLRLFSRRVETRYLQAYSKYAEEASIDPSLAQAERVKAWKEDFWSNEQKANGGTNQEQADEESKSERRAMT